MSVTLVATFCILMMEVFQDKEYYETYKWYFCGSLIGSGILFWLTGHFLRSKKKPGEEENSSASTLKLHGEAADSEDSEPEQNDGPFFLFSLQYWGPMLATFGAIVIFIVPLSSAKKVAARSTNAVPQVKAVMPPPPTNAKPVLAPIQPPKFPDVKVQGIIYRVGNPSVVLNGKGFFVGDRVGDAEIVAIERQSMTLEIGGQRKNYVLEK